MTAPPQHRGTDIKHTTRLVEHARREWSVPQSHRHILTNHVTSIEGDKATHRCYAYLVAVAERKSEPDSSLSTTTDFEG